MGIPVHPLDITAVVSSYATLAASFTVIVLAVLLAVKQTYTRLRKPRVILTRLHTSESAGRDLGVAATFNLRAALRQLRSEDSARVDLVTAAAAELELPAQVATAVPPSNLISALCALLDQLLPPLDTSVEGCLQPGGTDGVGITLTLSDRARGIGNSVTLRQRQYARVHDAATAGDKDDIDAYADLLIPAAVWVHFHTSEPPGFFSRIPLVTMLWARFKRPSGQPSTARRRRRKPFGVERWESYALAAAGAHLQAEADLHRARQLYAQALDIEPTNRLALFNLAVLDMRETSPFKLERARTRFKLVRELSELGAPACPGGPVEPITIFRRDGIWCRATYNLAVVNLLLVDQGSPKEHHSRIWEAADHISDVVDQFREIRSGSVPSEDPDPKEQEKYCAEMTDLVDQIDDQVLVTAAGILGRTGRTPPQRLRAALRAYLKVDASGTDAVIDAVKNRAQLTARGRYNLACCLARSKRDPAKLEQAMEELELALDGASGDLREWAKSDPPLQVFRGHEKYGQRFAELIGEPYDDAGPDLRIAS
jgi:tetratricopeptide (TPR) repeat protein